MASPMKIPATVPIATPSTIEPKLARAADQNETLAIVEGVAIGTVAGILIGVAMGRVREVNWFLSTYIRALYALPLIALVPLVIIWVGYQPAARLIIVAISAFLRVAVTPEGGPRAI